MGHSWGAMLALAYAAAHPNECGPTVLIGCGTFDPAARERMRAIIAERMTDPIRRGLEDLAAQIADPDAQMRARGALIEPLYSYDLAAAGGESGECNARAHDETWQDMMRMQDEGVYPAAFASIETPVLMLHGADDPHPGRIIRASLERYMPQTRVSRMGPMRTFALARKIRTRGVFRRPARMADATSAADRSIVPLAT